MIRRAFVKAFSGAVFASMLGVKVETWKLEEPEDEPVRTFTATIKSIEASSPYESRVRLEWTDEDGGWQSMPITAAIDPLPLKVGEKVRVSLPWI